MNKTDDQTMQTCRNIVNAERARVLTANLYNYDAMSESYLTEIWKWPADFTDLTARLSREIRKHQQKDVSLTPPSLCPLRGESADDFIKRIYRSGRATK